MKLKSLFLAAALVSTLVAPALAQNYPTPTYKNLTVLQGITGDVSGSTSTSTGGNSGRTSAARALDFGVNVRDFGAKGDGVTDDTAALNAAMTYLRSISTTNGGAAGVTGQSHAARYFIPAGVYLTSGTLNWTGLQSLNVYIEAYGANIYCTAAGLPCVDMMGDRWVHVSGLAITGASTSTPSIGLQLGRMSTASSDGHGFRDIKVAGQFTFAGIYELASEDTKFDHLFVWNGMASASAYGFVLDGSNHWNIKSAFLGTQAAQDVHNSFNEQLWETVSIVTTAGATPVWIEGAHRMNVVTSYIANTASGSNGIVMYFPTDTSSLISDLTLDVHFETSAMANAIFITGPNATPYIYGLKVREQSLDASNSLIYVDTGITGVTLNAGDIDVAQFAGAATVFAQPTLWSVSGRYSLPAGSAAWNLTSTQFTGNGNVGSAASFSGDGSGLTGVVGSFPPTISTSAISNAGAVNAINLTFEPSFSGGGQYYTFGMSSLFPTVTLAAPPPGGSQATASVSSMVFGGVNSTYISSNYLPFSGGTGYIVGDTGTINGGTASGVQHYFIMAVGGGGVVTEWRATGSNGIYSVVPSEPATTTTTAGVGTGLTLAGFVWNVKTVAIGSGGSGYTSTPAVTFQTSNISGATALTAHGTATLSSLLDITAGGSDVNLSASGLSLTSGAGKVLVNNSGAFLGVSGASGTPAISLGAMIDGSGIRQTLTSTYAVPANTSLVRFIQTGTLATSTVTLPTALADGQPIQFVNYAGTITALTFSPAVNGWTAGSTMAPNTGLRIRWDATSAAWFRE